MQVLLDDITIRLEERTAFEKTTWHILEGQMWAVLGGTGSGKSLLLRAICRQAPLSGGCIRYSIDHAETPEVRQYFQKDEILLFSPEAHREFLRRYASYYQARWQSIEGDGVPMVEDLLASSTHHGGASTPAAQSDWDNKEHEPEIEAAVELFALRSILKRRILHLSHGESRKVHIASLILRRPQLLLLDDPFTGLDKRTRGALREGVEALLRIGSPQVIIAVSRPEDLCDGVTHVAVVEGNRIAASGGIALLRDTAREKARSSIVKTKTEDGEKGEQDLDAMLGLYAERLEQGGSPGATKGDQVGPAVLARMEGVSVSYGGEIILKDIHWQMRRGERWALLGANGAGKTTLLSLVVADHPQAYANRIELFGKRRGSGESIWQIKQHIGLVSPELHIHYRRSISAFEVACSGFHSSTGLYQPCTPGQQEHARGWMRALQIQHLADKPFLRLSSGQQRMVILARALVNFPPLLVLDEPCQGLDAGARDRLVRFLDILCRRVPVSMVYVTHVQDELPAAITHYLLLERGRASWQGFKGDYQPGLENVII